MDTKKIIKKINSKEIGCNFFKADLHIHTPGSKDFKGQATPEEIVAKAQEKELDVIAIMDHNSIEWCEKIKKAAEKTNLTVFPGVEISASGGKLGLHFVAIFDENKPLQEIRDCLARIKLDSTKQGNVEALTSESHENILREVRESGGIVIGAHAYSDKGIISGMKGAQRTELIKNENLRAIEINDVKHIKHFDGKDNQYKRLLACIKSSDAHSVEDIGKEYTLIKMGEPTLEGLRQAFCDPESRIRFDSSQIHSHPLIVGMYVEGGFLDGEVFHFNDNMNTIIGGKGTGKTTAIELLRFALHSEHKNAKLKKEFEEMIRDILVDGCVYLLVNTKDQQRYIISRKVGEEAKIFRENGEQFNINIENFNEFFDLECYSQGELICIAQDSKNQLDMIDKYIDFRDYKDKEQSIVHKLNSNAESIIKNIDNIEDLQIKTERLPGIEEKIRIIEEKGLKKHSEIQKKWECEKNVINSLVQTIDNKIDELKKSESFAIDLSVIEKDEVFNKEIIDKFEEYGSIVKKDLEEEKTKVIEKIKKTLVTIKKDQIEWQKKYDAQYKKFKEITGELKSKGIDVDNFLQLEQVRNKLNGYKKEIVEKKKLNQSLLEGRKQLLVALFDVRSKISSKRKEEIDRINEQLKDILHISLKKEENKDEYTNWLIECLTGSRSQKTDTTTLCNKIKPFELVDIVENKRNDCIDILSSKTDLNKSYFERLLNHEPFMNKLYDLQTIRLEDSLEIKLNDQGWKTLNKLSTGGKCTAILLIAMLERNTPLIIDQPEDSLDNAFIYDSVVKIFRKLKDNRQMVIVTHNANIPVLGDCELMFLMHSNGLKGDIRARGVIDTKEIKESVQIILEGGKEAFMKRREKYGI